MSHRYNILDRIHERTGLSYKKLNLVYTTYFLEVRDVFRSGKHPGVVMTGLMSFQLSASAIKYKAKTLTGLIIEENYPALKKRFNVTTKDEARTELTRLIRMYKMKKDFDTQNTLAKRRKNNGWTKF